MKELIKELGNDKYKITSWNENLIEMKTFFSFLEVDIEKIEKHLGDMTGWTKYENKDIGLVIGGGWYNGVEYLHDIQYKEKLDNPWSNYVNPFYLFEIMNSEGKKFFLEYYREDINEIQKEKLSKAKDLKEKITSLEDFVYKSKTWLNQFKD